MIALMSAEAERQRQEPSIPPDLEEKKEAPPPKTVLISPEMQEFLKRLGLASKEKLPPDILYIINTNPLFAAAILELNATLPVSNKIIIILAKHEKYVKKIVDALVLLRRDHVLLTEKSIADIAASEHFVDYVADALIIFNAKFLLFANITNIKKIEKIETIIAGVAKAGFLAKSVVEALLTLSEQQVPLTRRIINAFVKVEDAKNLAKALISLHENGIDLTEHVVNSVAEAEYFSLHAARALIKVKKAGIPLANNNIRMITEAGKDAHNFANCLIGNLNNNVVVRPPVASPPKENEVEHKRSCSPGSR